MVSANEYTPSGSLLGAGNALVDEDLHLDATVFGATCLGLVRCRKSVFAPLPAAEKDLAPCGTVAATVGLSRSYVHHWNLRIPWAEDMKISTSPPVL